MRHLLLVLPLLLCGFAQAETVFMKDGQTVTGGVVWRGRSGIELRIGAGCVGEGEKVFIEVSKIESVNDCADCAGEWGITEVPESRLEFEKRMKERGRVFYKAHWVSVYERDDDEARIKAEKEKAAAKEEKITPLTPATPKATPRSTPAPTPATPPANNGATPTPAPAPAPAK